MLTVPAIFREIGDRMWEATTLNIIGVAYHSLSDHEQALAYLEQALPIFREIGDRMGEATMLNDIGAVYHGLSDYEQALEYYQRALPIWREIGTPLWVAKANRAGFLPTRNFSSGVFELADEISGETMRRKIVVENRACYGCPILCGKLSRVDEGKHQGIETGNDREDRPPGRHR